MLKVHRIATPSPEQWKIIIEGMRNPMNSWDKSDSTICPNADGFEDCKMSPTGGCPRGDNPKWNEACFCIGENDLTLMHNLAAAGTDHRKYLRMTPVWMTVTAPLYWWKEYDTYKVGTVANSCSTMHKIHSKEFTLDDVSHEHFDKEELDIMEAVIYALNWNRRKFLETGEKKYWYRMIQLLPSSYNQKRTLFLNYENLINIYRARKNHKLDEWHTFCDAIEKMPYFMEVLNG
jgi:hypothetical protein